MKTQRFLPIVFPVLCVLAIPALAFAEGWGLPSWNPFKPAPKKSSFASARKEPTTWQKVSKSTSDTWTKTTSAVNPWKKDKTPPRPTGSARRPSNMPQKQESKATWYNPLSWLPAEEPAPRNPASVSEFLNQPRVPY